MVKRILSVILLVLFVIIAIVLFNTFRFSKTDPPGQSLPITGISDSAALST